MFKNFFLLIFLFAGRNCEDDIDECVSLKPCVYGICQNEIGNFDFSLLGL